MRIHRIRLSNFRGIDEFEMRVRDSGVTIVEGPNESGKTSVAQAIDLAFEHLDSSTKTVIRALKPVHRDAGSEVLLELTTGPYRVVYTKRWHRAPSTTLVVSLPRPEQHTGREAHDRMRAILDETLDVSLWRALQVQQGTGDEQAVPADSPSLLAALDAAASIGAQDAEGDGTLWQRVVDERDRYATPTGKPSAERKRLADQVTAAEKDAARFAEEVAVLDDAAERHRRVTDQRARLQGDLVARRGTADEHRVAWSAVEEQRREADRLRLIADAAARDADDADRLRIARHAAIREARAAADEAQSLRERLVPATAAMQGLERIRDVARQVRDSTRDARRGAEQAVDRAEAAVLHHRRVADRSTLAGRLDAVRLAEGDLRDAETVLAGAIPVDDDDVRVLTEEHVRLASAVAALRAGAPVVRLEAIDAVELTVDGAPVSIAAGDHVERVGQREVAIEVPGIARVVVTAGDDAASLARDVDDARDALASRCARLGLPTDGAVEAARSRAAERQSALTRRDEAGRRRRDLLADSTVAVLEDRLAALDARIDGDLQNDPAIAALDQAGAEQRRDDAAARLQVARDEERDAETRLEPLEQQLRDRASEVQDATIRSQLADEHATGRAEALAAARAAAGDEALVAQASVSADTRAAADARLQDAEQVLSRLDPENVRLLLDNAEQVLEDLEAQDRDLHESQLKMSAVLEARGEDALQERLDDALSLLARLRTERDAIERRAAAALLLHATFEARRRAARAALVRPFQDRIEALGRIVFGQDLAVGLGEDLRIVSRTLGGRTVSWDALSTGAREQFGVIVRLACASIVAADGEGVPVVLDDVFSHSDDTRLERMGALLSVAGREGQVLVLTCAPDRFRDVGGATVLHMADLLSTAVAAAQPPVLLAAADEAVLEALGSAREPLSKAQILELTGLDQDVWVDTIQALVGSGAVEQIGQTKGTRYRIA